MRLFLAMGLHAQVLDAIESAISPVRTRLDRLRWVRRESWHITLKFYGEVDESVAEALAEGTRGLARAPIPARLVGLGAFPSPRSPRVVWVGVQEPAGALVALQEAAEVMSEAHGFARERRRFHPHVTVARARKGRPRDLSRELTPLQDVEIAATTLDELVLFRSELHPSGARYHAVETVRLA